MKKLFLTSILALSSVVYAGPGITIDIEPYPIGEIEIPEPGGMA